MATTAPRVGVTALTPGWIKIPDAYFVRGKGPLGGPRAIVGCLLTPRGRYKRAPLPAFLLEHPDHGPLLVDCGPPPDVASLGVPFRFLFGYAIEEPLTAQLQRHGVAPEEVGTVVLTHTHYDHVGGSTLLPRARFVLSAEEDADPPARTRGTYVEHRRAAHAWAPVALDGGPLGPFAASHDLLGDGSIVLVALPGHTPGHVGVLLTLPDGRPCLLSGDAFYRLRELESQATPLLVGDIPQYHDSVRRIRAWRADHPDGVIAGGHDPEGWATMIAGLHR